MSHGAQRLDSVVSVCNGACCSGTASYVSSAGAEYGGLRSVSTPGSEFHNRSSFGGSHNSVCLGGNEALMVDGQQNHGFNELSLHYGTSYGDYRFMGENRRSLRYCPHVAFEFKVPEVIKKFFTKHIFASQIFDILFCELKVFEIVNGLLQPCHNGKAASVRNLSEEHVKICYVFSHSGLKIPVRHRQLVKVSQHSEI